MDYFSSNTQSSTKLRRRQRAVLFFIDARVIRSFHSHFSYAAKRKIFIQGLFAEVLPIIFSPLLPFGMVEEQQQSLQSRKKILLSQSVRGEWQKKPEIDKNTHIHTSERSRAGRRENIE